VLWTHLKTDILLALQLYPVLNNDDDDDADDDGDNVIRQS
jgi:hypothetical protein